MGQVVIGHLTIDNISGANSIKIKNCVPGGAAMYAACGAAIWNDAVTVISKLGKDYVLYERLNEGIFEGINTSYLIQVDVPSIRLDIQYDINGEHTFVPLGGIKSYSEMAPDSEDITDEVLQENRVFHITPLPILYQRSIIDKIRSTEQEKKSITLDPDILDITYENTNIWMDILGRIDVLILSMVEFNKFESLISSEKEEKDIFDRIYDLQYFFSVKNIVLRAGKQGAYLVKADGKKYHIGIIDKHYTDYTGAGDAFAGGLGYAIDNGYSLERGLVYGTVSSSVAMMEFGYEHMLAVSQKELEEMIKDIERKL